MPPTESFEEIVAEHQQLVFRTLARLLGRTDRLEDLAQDVFLRLFRALPAFRGDAALTTYLYRIVHNVAQDEYTRRRRERGHVSLSAPVSPEPESPTLEDQLADPTPNAFAELDFRQFCVRVQDQLLALRPIERTILILFHQEDQTYEQIALTLALPINTVRTHLHRARAQLRAALQPNPTQHDPSTFREASNRKSFSPGARHAH